MRGEIDICFLCIILLGAGWSDLYCGKVYNSWLLTGMFFGLAFKGWDFIPAALLVLVPSYILFCMKAMGAGDGKLMALIAGYIGIDAGLKAIFTGMLIGSAWSLYRLYRNQDSLNRIKYLAAEIWRMLRFGKRIEYESLPLAGGKTTIPLAGCLAAGTYVYLFVSRFVMAGKEAF